MVPNVKKNKYKKAGLDYIYIYIYRHTLTCIRLVQGSLCFYFILLLLSNHIVDDSMIKLETKGFTFLVFLSSSFVVANIMVTGGLYGR